MDNIDKYISDIVRKKIKEPADFESKIRNTLKIQKKHFILNELVKKVAAVIISISAVGGIAFAAKKSGIFNNNNNNQYSIENNEYIQQLDMQYQTIDNLSIKVDSILVDDFNIQIEMDYLYNEPITSANSKILVKDDKNNILYRNVIVDSDSNDFLSKKVDRKTFEKKPTIINEGMVVYNQDITEKEIETKAYTTGYKSMYEKVNSNHIKNTINLYRDLETEKFPNSKKIYIQLEDVILKNNKNKVKEIKGTWNFEIDIKEEFRNRQTWKYIEINNETENNNFKVVDAELSNVQLLLKIENTGNIDLSSLKSNHIQIWDEQNSRFIVADGMKIVDGNIVDVSYNINSKMFSDVIKGKIEGYEEFFLKKIT